MRYALALLAAFAVVVVGGTILRQLPDGTWPAYLVTALMLIGAAVAVRQILRR